MRASIRSEVVHVSGVSETGGEDVVDGDVLDVCHLDRHGDCQAWMGQRHLARRNLKTNQSPMEGYVM